MVAILRKLFLKRIEEYEKLYFLWVEELYPATDNIFQKGGCAE